MSRRSTGNLYEKYCKAYLEADGYVCHRATASMKNVGKFFVSQANDVFSCIDIIAKKKGERTRWIQVTSESVGIGVKAKKMEIVPWDNDHDSVEVWQFHSGRITKANPLAQYFQVRLLEQDYALKDENRIFLSSSFRQSV